MKIIRHQSPTGPAYAALQPDGSARAITGDIYGDFKVTDQVVTPGKLLAPIQPAQILCIGLNYAKHAAESGAKVPERPVLFVKGINATQNPGDPIEIPTKLASHEVDYECELAVVIGAPARNVSAVDAMAHVAGYTVCNDYAFRDYLENWYRPNLRVKNRDGATVLGPWFVDAADVPDPHDLTLRTLVNGQVTQQGHTSNMVNDIPSLIEYLSSFMTLQSGDVILTGTPDGVINVNVGDEVITEIDGIGRLVNTIVGDEPYGR
ncbi:MAG: fumarylacetoacetate hydrolase family protein [Cephaloticoccus sp.]|nr:fumarylacetoacetate hydrolase family protein [Cephaloticoccus sp.]